ncbi:MAG: hypothetical protein OXC31_30325 [Spirochaetaceae bacterium]|nr:hypothetical protein [Spirochaetaceae bacterium]
MNRYEKVDRDAAEWLPAQNRCWFAARAVAVRQRYGVDHVPAGRDAGGDGSLGPRSGPANGSALR